ncbi:hypothetical protein F5J12DRAFT_785835 [Pisolithus orientalis]|uniref:uncharacterized protein n=1 Tax=Pisolithus orientalis TaxID=936130 RepID=UPI002224925A|nr:uncharacterized protein F5J12DRAFT_785835 [Pisolithus orientalis]KAI5994273.1 hypothetical protein F5J12DRAFT_785835 [Pisolithus orientalis]
MHKFPLANEWHVLLGQSLLSRTAVWFSDVVSLFDHFLASMPYEKPLEMTNAFQQIIAQHTVLNSSMCLHQENDMDAMSSAVISSKCLCEEVRSMDNPPTPNKHFKGSPPIGLKESQSVATAGLHHSGRAGAGSGGRAEQLEWIDLPNNSIVNPLAPPPTQWKKGGGHSAGQNAKLKSNVAPPPYAPPIVNGPSPADMPPNPVPQSSMAVATPVFHQHPTDSHHSGFSVLAQQSGDIMPPWMEPDFQVLNNPQLFSLSSRQTLATTDVFHKSSEKLSSEGSSEEELETSNNNPSDAEAGEVSSDESNKDEDNAFGWGAMNLRQSTHPGLSQEMMTSNPICHNSLPPDHEFTYSCDEDDDAALQSLQSKDKAQPEGSQCGAVPGTGWRGCLRASMAVWVQGNDLLELVSCLWAAHALSNPFPLKSHNLNLSITEVLITVIIEWNQHSVQFEASCWPHHKQDMVHLIKLKSVVLETMPSVFNLIPPSDVAPWVHVQWIETTATKLLVNSLFLLVYQGKTRNFTHSTFKEAVIQFYHTGTYQIMDKHPESFSNSVPLSCLALIAATYHCVLDGFVKNGTGKTMPQFSGKAYNSIFHGMMKVLNNILCNPYHSMRLCDQLSQWVKEGWAALQEVDMNYAIDANPPVPVIPAVNCC